MIVKELVVVQFIELVLVSYLVEVCIYKCEREITH